MRTISCAVAGILLSGEGMAEPSVTPPSRFDHPAGNVVVVPRTPAQIKSVCTIKHASPWPGGGVGACALYNGKNKPCIILWPRGVPRTGVLWRHERAHCNGWAANHPR